MGKHGELADAFRIKFMIRLLKLINTLRIKFVMLVKQFTIYITSIYFYFVLI